jgi:agmatinase
MTWDAARELTVLLRPAGGGLYLVSSGLDAQRRLQRRFYDADSEADVTSRYLAELARVPSAEVVVLGIPSDVGAGFRRGANLGPQAIRARLLDDDPAFHTRCAAEGVVDLGDVFVVPQLLHDDMLAPQQLARSRVALYPDVPEAVRDTLPVSPLSIAERVLDLVFQLNPRARPLVLGGDHSAAYPVVEALYRAGKRFCILQFDAHTDLLRERLGVRVCFATWSYHANLRIGGAGRLIQAGVRASQHPREHWESTQGVRQFWPEEYLGEEARLVDDVVAAVRATGLPVYISNDIDGTDAAFADATGTPEPHGLSVDAVRNIIARVAQHVEVLAADVMEVAPLLGADGGHVTVGVAAEYARAALSALRSRAS